MSDPDSKLSASGESAFDKLEVSQKKCVISGGGKTANCTFKLGEKKFSVQMILTGNAWSYKEVYTAN